MTKKTKREKLTMIVKIKDPKDELTLEGIINC